MICNILNERIVVQWNNEDQPIVDGGALLNTFLGIIERNQLFLLTHGPRV